MLPLGTWVLTPYAELMGADPPEETVAFTPIAMFGEAELPVLVDAVESTPITVLELPDEDKVASACNPYKGIEPEVPEFLATA